MSAGVVLRIEGIRSREGERGSRSRGEIMEAISLLAARGQCQETRHGARDGERRDIPILSHYLL